MACTRSWKLLSTWQASLQELRARQGNDAHERHHSSPPAGANGDDDVTLDILTLAEDDDAEHADAAPSSGVISSQLFFQLYLEQCSAMCKYASQESRQPPE